MWAGLLCLLAEGGVTQVAIADHAHPSDYRDADIRLRRLDTGAPGPYVWAVAGRGWSARCTLYSPKLRQRLSHAPRGTTIGVVTNPTAPVVIGKPIPDQRALDDFSTFCKAHGLCLFYVPVA